MKYYIITEERKRNKDTGLMPVIFLFKYANKRFSITSRINVKNKCIGIALPSCEPNSRAKSKKLTLICNAIDKFLLEGDTSDIITTKRKLKEIITGEEQEPAETLSSLISDFAETKKKQGTRELYMLTAKKVDAYRASSSISDVDSKWLDGFVDSLGNVSTNYISIHLRNIRSVFNWAIDNEITTSYPFRKYKIKTERVRIKNITVDELRAIRDCKIPEWMEIYRDLFMLSFYLCGINPIDLLNLTKKNIKGGRVVYNRAKTGRLYDIPLPDEAAVIIEKYKGKTFLLNPLEHYSSHKDFCHHWNAALKKIGSVEVAVDRAGKMRKIVYHPIVDNLTIYVARYTFASIGAELDIPRETIALCLGHSWSDVTSHYIAYNRKKIDDAVKRIIEYIK